MHADFFLLEDTAYELLIVVFEVFFSFLES